MIGPEETDDRLTDFDGGYAEGAENAGTPHYDPLFHEWQESPPQDDADAFDTDDVFWLAGSDSQPSGFEGSSAVADSGHERLSPASPWLPPAAPVLSPLQQQVRVEAAPPPRPSRRSQGVQVMLIGLALLVLGFIAVASDANGLGPFTSKSAAYGALIGGALLTSAGVAGATFGLPLPLPGVITLREIAETVLLAMLIFLAVRATFQNFKVEGASMQPSLHNQQYLIVNKLSYAGVDLSIFNFLPFVHADDNDIFHLWGSPSRGDIIVFHAPESPGRDFIKRIIGTPGDTVEINPGAGKVSVNGSVLEEPYIQGTTNCNGSCTFAVPPEGSQEARNQCGSNACYFVMGDNRQNSSDSRGGWLVPEENIIGKTLITYWDEGKVNVELAPNHSIQFANKAAANE